MSYEFMIMIHESAPETRYNVTSAPSLQSGGQIMSRALISECTWRISDGIARKCLLYRAITIKLNNSQPNIPIDFDAILSFFFIARILSPPVKLEQVDSEKHHKKTIPLRIILKNGNILLAIRIASSARRTKVPNAFLHSLIHSTEGIGHLALFISIVLLLCVVTLSSFFSISKFEQFLLLYAPFHIILLLLCVFIRRYSSYIGTLAGWCDCIDRFEFRSSRLYL